MMDSSADVSSADLGKPRDDTAQGRALAYYIAIGSVIAQLLSLFYICKKRGFAFVDVGSDTFLHYLPVQIAEVRQLRDLHDLTWSFNLGLGGYIGTAFDPIQLLAVLFPDSWQLGIRLPLYLFKLLLGGGFFFGYLRKLGFEPRLSVFGALAFAFSSYMMVNGQWDPYASKAVQFAAYLYFFEAFVRGGSHWHAVAAGLTVGLGEAFDVYTLSLLSVLYALARTAFANKGKRLAYLRVLPRYGMFATLGFLLAAPIQFPHLYYLFDSPRVSSVLPQLWGLISQLNDRATISAEIAGLFGKDLLGTGSAYQGWANYFEGPGFYVGLLPMLCIPQLLGPSATLREKRFCVIGITLTIAYVFWPALRFAVYGFGHSAFRLSTLWVSAGLIVLGLAGLRRAIASGTWRTGLLIAAIGIFIPVLATTALLPQAVNITHVIKIVGFAAIYCAILWLLPRLRARSFAIPVLLPVFACELLLFSAPAMIDRIPVNLDGTSASGSYDDGTLMALALVRAQEGNEPFYRVEKTYDSTFLCDALVQDYHGIKSYFFHGSSVTRFVNEMHLPRPVEGNVSYIGSAVTRPLVLNLLGVKYLLARDRKLDGVIDFAYVGAAAGINVYRNNADHGFVHIYDTIIDEGAAAQLNQDQRDQLLLKAVLVQDSGSVKRELERIASADAPSPDFVPSSATLHMERDNLLTGLAQTQKAAVLLIAMPFDIGWSARLDDEKVDLFRADYGLTAMLVPAGKHDIRLRYVPPGKELGVWLFLLASTVLGISGLYNARSRRD